MAKSGISAQLQSLFVGKTSDTRVTNLFLLKMQKKGAWIKKTI